MSDISGRGIGLDVVRLRLLQIGGEVTVSSTLGFGTTFELRVPLALTVAPVLFVDAGGERWCVPASSVLQTVKLTAACVLQVVGRPAVVVNEDVLPFATIASVLGVAPERAPLVGETALVLRGRGQQAVLGVDKVLEELVQPILPFKGLLASFGHLSGATPRPDGSLALLLSAQHLVAVAHGRASPLRPEMAVTASARRSRVLVVDDSPLTRDLLVTMLENAGYVVLQAADGAAALELLGHEPVDLVATDLEMPSLDGIELTQRLKRHDTLGRLPVVIVTTRGSENDRRRGLEAGANGYVTKGDLVRQELLEVVARLLGHHPRV